MSCPHTEDGFIIVTPKSLTTVVVATVVALGTVGVIMYYTLSGASKSRGEYLVDSQHGLVKTVMGRTITEYLGVKYAKVLSKSDRFAPSDILEYQREMNLSSRPPCPQLPWSPIPTLLKIKSHSTDDCLRLNIWRPGQASIRCKPKPVVVVFHGGRFQYGGGGTYLYYDGQFMAATWDVVVVTPAYRVGVLGFLNAQTADAPGNAGLTDQVNALRWVHRYIDQFGGDRDRVTLLGEEAGAASVGYHLIHQQTSTLFQKAILLSGSPFMPVPDNSGATALLNANSLAEILGCEVGEEGLQDLRLRQEMVACLRRRTPLAAVNAGKKLSSSSDRALFGPTLSEGYRWKRGETAKTMKPLDILIGYTKSEGTSYVTEAMNIFELPANQLLSATKMVSMLRKFLDMYGIKDSSEIIQYYGYNNLTFASKLGVLLIEEVAVALGDFFVYCPVMYFLEEVSREGSRVFFYEFTYSPNYKWWGSWLGVPQFLDYVFATGFLDIISESAAVHENDKILAQDMAKMFAGFVKTGNPNTLPNVLWQRWKASASTPLKMDYAANGEYNHDPQYRYRNECDMWRNYL
ncbi:cholinesterase 1-like [Ornithodoros turicata]|uniref:cholinesterase 1-like n=1 Tax=Ornithodoros turicata TaxID=34597 RepID=UPI0031398F16